MEKQHMEAVENYMKMVQGALRAPGNNYRYEIVMHLTIAYYYGLGTYLHKTESDSGTASRLPSAFHKFGPRMECYFLAFTPQHAHPGLQR